MHQSADTVAISRTGKLTRFFAFWLLCLSSCSGLRENAEKLDLSGVFIIRADDGLGTCFIVGRDSDKTYVATAAHCVNGASIVRVPAARTTKVLAVDISNDAALLECTGLPRTWKAYPLRTKGVQVGEPCVAVGYISFRGRRTTGFPVWGPAAYPGYVVNVGLLGRIWCNTGVYRGMSGGPVFDAKGRVLGIVSGAAYWEPGIADSTDSLCPAVVIERMLEQVRRRAE